MFYRVGKTLCKHTNTANTTLFCILLFVLRCFLFLLCRNVNLFVVTLHAHSVQGLIFVASLIDYHCVLYEDASVNSMVECVELFVDMINKDCFNKCSIILLLNKDDLLRQKLKEKDNGLGHCFGPNRWPNENEFWDTSVCTIVCFVCFFFFIFFYHHLHFWLLHLVFGVCIVYY